MAGKDIKEMTEAELKELMAKQDAGADPADVHEVAEVTYRG